MTWDVTLPTGSDDVREGDNRIRELKLDLQDTFQSRGYFPIDTSSPEFQYYGEKGDTASRPTNGEAGFYFDTDTQDLLRDNGVSYDRVAVSFPATTKALFYEATAPTGWTIDSSADDRLIFNKSASGGTNGGAWDGTTSSNGAHTHQVGKHYVSGSNHGIMMYAGTYGDVSRRVIIYEELNQIGVSTSYSAAESTVTGTVSSNEDFNSSSTGAHTHSQNHDASDHAYVKVIICEKD
jgi:hypothetical protein